MPNFKLKGSELFDSNNKRLATIRGNDIYDASNRRLATLRGSDVYDGSGGKIGSLGEIKKSLDGALGGMSVIALWLCCVR